MVVVGGGVAGAFLAKPLQFVADVVVIDSYVSLPLCLLSTLRLLFPGCSVRFRLGDELSYLWRSLFFMVYISHLISLFLDWNDFDVNFTGKGGFRLSGVLFVGYRFNK